MTTSEERDLEFRSTPAQLPKSKKYKLLRVPGRGYGNLVLLGHAFIWHDLHYWRRRTIPHFADNCEPCEHNCQIRERGYIAVAGKLQSEVMILEVTDNCGDTINDMMKRLNDLRGSVVNLSRLEKRDNGKLTIHPDGKQIDGDLIPASPDVGEVLRRIWGLAKTHRVNVPLSRTLILDKLRCSVHQPGSNGEEH